MPQQEAAAAPTTAALNSMLKDVLSKMSQNVLLFLITSTTI
jgi:hypothetical protein